MTMSQLDPHPDPRPPVACDMSNAQDSPEERREEYRRLFSGFLTGRERSRGRLTFRFLAAPGVREWLTDLAAREEACCAFLTIAVTATLEHEVRWDITVFDDELARRALDDFGTLPERLGVTCP